MNIAQRPLVWIAITIVSATIAACHHHGGNNDSGAIQIKTLSNRADLVSGGNAYVEIVMPEGKAIAGLSVTVGGRDVTSAFATRPSGRILGVITGLAIGDNVVLASYQGNVTARLTINNHPIGGPVFTGAQTQPFICATPAPQAATATTPATNASGLTRTAIDAQCNIPTEVKLYYKSNAATAANCTISLPDPNPPANPPANGCFKTYEPANPPAAVDIATTTNDRGVTVPYIVRVERGTINRGIYDIAVLFDPARDDPTAGWKPYAPQSGWNGKVLYTFGASTGQPRTQFRSEQNWPNAGVMPDDSALRLGFMVVDNSMTDSLYNSNRPLNAETLMMMKEHIIDNYGEIRYTIGNGCSGGSINQNTAQSIYPGLLDGILPTCTYVDSQTTGIEVSDCVALVNYYATNPFGVAGTSGVTQAQIDAKKTAINGHLDQRGCHAWFNFFGTNGIAGNFVTRTVNATGAITLGTTPVNNCRLLPSQVYDPVTNPTGPRCSDVDNAVAIWGTVPVTLASGTTVNRAQITRDNTGVQYGLKAVVSGAVTAEEFVTLNERIGGFDFDGNASPNRAVADAKALETAYNTGIVGDGKNLGLIPIIDTRGYDEPSIHHIWRSFSYRARIDASNGDHGNLVLWRFPPVPPTAASTLLAPAASGLSRLSLVTMDKWLANVEADKSDKAARQKVIAAKPAGDAAFPASDFCYLSTDTGFATGTGTKVFSEATCNADPLLVTHASPRQVAGGNVAEDVLKCQLKPVSAADYAPAAMTAAQVARLTVVFPGGVCDYGKPGVNQKAASGPYTFQSGAFGQPLGPAPTSGP
ncbi:MAG: DUF6351 family protein [Usitatibacter sp.]